MNNKTVNDFIQSAILKTKRKVLKWRSLSGKADLLKKSSIDAQLSACHGVASTISAMVEPSINYDFSFYADYKQGHVFLLCCDRPALGMAEQGNLKLCVQNSSSPFSKVLAETPDNDIEINAQLKRLYNIVVEYTNDLDAFIDDFINS